MHVDVMRQINQIWQITMLSEELREGNELSGCCGVALIWRPEDYNDITTTIRVQ